MVSQHNTKRAMMGAGTAGNWMTSQDASKRETLIAVQRGEDAKEEGFAE